MVMKPRDRIDYSAMADREPLKLPDGKRVAVWVIVNIENWDIEKPMARTVLPPPGGQVHIPDIPNWSWQEYGMRCLLYTSPSPRDRTRSRMPSSA